MATKVVAVLLVLAILVGGIFGIRALRTRLATDQPAESTPTPTQTVKTSWTQEESQVIARNYVLISPTYAFDGHDLQLVSAQALGCTGCYVFSYSFVSNNGGYGNRTGQPVTHVITPHQIVVTVQQGQITSAVTDSVYDELNQATK